jgi:hypothetical protein
MTQTKQKKIPQEEIDDSDDEFDGKEYEESNEIETPKAEDFELMEPGKEIEAVIFSVGNIEINHHEKFGDKPFANIGVEFNGKQEALRLFLPKGHMIRPNSTAGKVFKEARVSKLKDLVGKKVLVKVNKEGYLRFAVED